MKFKKGDLIAHRDYDGVHIVVGILEDLHRKGPTYRMRDFEDRKRRPRGRRFSYLADVDTFDWSVVDVFENAAPNTLVRGICDAGFDKDSRHFEAIERMAFLPECADREIQQDPLKLPARAVWDYPGGMSGWSPSCRSRDVKHKNDFVTDDGDVLPFVFETFAEVVDFLSTDPAIAFDPDDEMRPYLISEDT